MLKKKLSLFSTLLIAIIVILAFSFCFAEKYDYSLQKEYSLQQLSGNEIQIDQLSNYINSNLSLSQESQLRVIVKFSDNIDHDITIDLKKINVESELNYTYSSIFNGCSITISSVDLLSLTKLSYIESVSLCSEYFTLGEYYSDSSNTNEGIFKNDTLYSGEGMSVAIIDSSFDVSHSAFSNISSSSLALTKDSIKDVLYSLNSYKQSNVSAVQLSLSDKIVYAYDYGESDLDLFAEGDNHGTHVAGIIGGNDTSFSGVVKNAQLLMMKVSDQDGAMYTDTIVAALEDCDTLNVDAVNMSLGSLAGFSYNEDDVLCEVINQLKDKGITVICAAGNEYTSSYGAESGDLSNEVNIDNGSVSSPASYEGSFSVGNAGEFKWIQCGENKIFALDGYYTKTSKYGNFYKDLLGANSNKTILYQVLLQNKEIVIGDESSYEGYDVEGKIVVVKRGEISFSEKISIAKSKGAIGIIVINETDSLITAGIDIDYSIPFIMMKKSDGDTLVSNSDSTGLGEITLDESYLQTMMSNSSSQGVLNDLSFGVDFVSYGTNIYSTGNNQSYIYLSGTSMAAPNATGAFIALKQYVKENSSLFLDENTNIKISEMATKLLMSNTTILKDSSGVYISPRQQGAGMINLSNAISNRTVLSSISSFKSKIELNDQIAKDGKFSIEFFIENYNDTLLTYSISVEVLSELVKDNLMTGNDKKLSFSIEKIETEAPYTYSDELGYLIDVGQKEKKKVTITINLSSDSIEYLNQFSSGMYIEGFVIIQSQTIGYESVISSIPYIGFYGDWENANMLDSTYYEDEQGNEAYVRPSTSYGIYAGTYYVPMGAFAYKLDDDIDAPTANEKYAALSIYSSSMYSLGYIQLGLLRNAEYIIVDLIDNVSGEILYSYESNYNGKTMYLSSYSMLYGGDLFVDISPYSLALENNREYTTRVRVYRTYEEESDNSFSEYNQGFTVDFEQPKILGAKMSYIDNSVTIQLYDNHYLQALFICTGNNQSSSISLNVQKIIPITNQTKKGETINVKVDLSDIDTQSSNGYIYYYVVDYAFNYAIYYDKTSSSSSIGNIINSSTEGSDKPSASSNISTQSLQFKVDSIELKINEEIDLFSNNYLSGLNISSTYTWTSSNKSVVAISNGKVTGLSSGVSVIQVTSKEGLTASVVIKVGSEKAKDTVSYEDTIISSFINKNIVYGTELFFGVDIDSSIIEMAPNEAFSFEFSYKPYNYNYIEAPIEILIESDNASIVSTINNVVTAISNGEANITKKANGEVIATYLIKVCPSIYIDENLVLKACFDNSQEIDLSLSNFTSIAANAFTYSNGVNKVIFPNTCNTISAYAFENCTSLQNIELSSVSHIGANAFKNCSSLLSIDLSKVDYVGENAFYGCINLSKVVLDVEKLNNLNVSSSAFTNCSLLKEFTIHDEINGDSTTKSIVIDEVLVLTLDYNSILTDTSIKVLGKGSMSNIKESKIDLSNSLIERISQETFKNNDSLCEIVLPSTLTYIGDSAFSGCANLSQVTFNSSTITIQDNAFANTKIASIDLSNVEVELGDEVFIGCSELVYANLGKVMSMGKYTFALDEALYMVEFEEGSLDIGTYTFALCIYNNKNYYHDNLKYVIVPNSITCIPEYSFAFCKNIDFTYADFSNVTTVEEEAFIGVESFLNIRFNNLSQIGYGAFAQSSINTIVIGSSLSDKNAIIGELAFYECSELTNVILPSGDNKVEIQMGAFYACESLQNINLSNVTDIKDYAFANCEKLEKVNVASALNIGKYAFAGCTNLYSVDISSAETIKDYAFAETELSSITIPDSIKYIGQAVFANVENLSISISDENTSSIVIDKTGNGDIVLYNRLYDDTLMLIYYPRNAKDTFYEVLDGTSYIGAYAFAGNSYIKSISMSNVSYIGSGAFYQCENLNSVSIFGIVPTLVTDTSALEEDGIYYNFTSIMSEQLPIIVYASSDVISDMNSSYMYSTSFYCIIETSDSVDYSILSELVMSLNNANINNMTNEELEEIISLYSSMSEKEKELLENSLTLANIKLLYNQANRLYNANSAKDNSLSAIFDTTNSLLNLPTGVAVVLFIVIAIAILAIVVLITLYLSKKVLEKKTIKEGKTETKKTIKEIFGEKNDNNMQ